MMLKAIGFWLGNILLPRLLPIFAACISTHQAWSTALEWFPDSCTIFETMLKEAL